MNSCSASEKDVRLTCFAFKIVVLRIKNPPFSRQKIWRQNGDKNLVSRFSNAEKTEFLIKKNSSNSEESEELVREAGLEPARPEWTLEPESSESANSTTRAFAVFRLLRYIITDPPACQADFSFLRLFFAFFLPRNAALPRAPLHKPHISCREGTDNEPVRSRIHAHSVDLDEEISKIGSLLAKTADFGRGTRT